MIFSFRHFRSLWIHAPYVERDPFAPRPRSKGEKARNKKRRK